MSRKVLLSILSVHHWKRCSNLKQNRFHDKFEHLIFLAAHIVDSPLPPRLTGYQPLKSD